MTEDSLFSEQGGSPKGSICRISRKTEDARQRSIFLGGYYPRCAKFSGGHKRSEE